jgi:hypothetical protein
VKLLVAGICLLAACGGGAHHHATPIEGDPGHLYVEVTASGDQEDALAEGANGALARMPFAVPVDDRGQVELEASVAELAVRGEETTCRVKVMVLRLPKDALIGLAEGSARTRGTGDQAAADCVEHLTGTLIKGKVRGLLRRELRGRR